MATVLVLIAAILLNLVSLASAGDQDVFIDRILVTPNRNSVELATTPSTVTVLTQEQIEHSLATNIPELLSKEGSVTMRDFIGNGKTTNADIRGFGETGLSNVLVLVDGRRVNNIDLSGTDWTQLPVSMVQRIEIIRGPASVLYGDNASGGVINIITKDPQKEKCSFQANAYAGSYATVGTKEEVSVSTKGLSFLGLYDHLSTSGYRVNSDMVRNDYNGKLLFDLNESIGTRVSFGDHQDKYGLPGALTDAQLAERNRRATVKPDDFASSRDYFFDLGLNADAKEAGQLQMSFARRNRDTSANFVTDFFLSERDTVTVSSNIRYTYKGDFLRHEHALTAGIDYQDAQEKIEEGMVGGEPDELVLSQKNYGIYLQDQWYASERLSLSPGYRYEHVKYNFEQMRVLTASEAAHFGRGVLSAAANYSYRDHSNVYASFSQSFRNPLVDEFFVSKYDFGFGPGGGLNTGLIPQKANNYEIGLRHSLNQRSMLSLSLYRMDVRDEIYLEPSTFTNTNYDKTVHQGAECGAQITLNKYISLSADYAFTDAFFNGGMYDKKKIPAVPTHRWSTAAELTLAKGLTLGLCGNYVGERYFVSDQTNELPRMASYLTFDAKLTFSKDTYSLFIALNNIFNEEYYEYGAANYNRTKKNYYPAPERNFLIGGRISF